MDVGLIVSEMLLGVPAFVPDLTYPELHSVLDAVVSSKLTEAEDSYYLAWLDVNLPGADVSDLIYWPNEWCNNETLLDVELTTDQLLAYAMNKSGRVVSGAPENVDLPYPIPASS
jgi:hypothetical protein